MHENSKRAYKNTKKYCTSFKLDKSNAVSVGMAVIKPLLYLVSLAWFARYCGKMYSRHRFSYGGLVQMISIDITESLLVLLAWDQN